MDRCTPPEEDRRNVVQRRTTRSNWRNGTQEDVHTSPSRSPSIRTSRNQQNVPTYKPQILVAEHEARRNGLRKGVRRMPKEQGQYQTYQSTTVPHISHTRSYAIRNCRPRLHH